MAQLELRPHPPETLPWAHPKQVPTPISCAQDPSSCGSLVFLLPPPCQLDCGSGLIFMVCLCPLQLTLQVLANALKFFLSFFDLAPASTFTLVLKREPKMGFCRSESRWSRVSWAELQRKPRCVRTSKVALTPESTPSTDTKAPEKPVSLWCS